MHFRKKGKEEQQLTLSAFCRSSWIYCLLSLQNSSDAGFGSLQVCSPGMFLVGFSSFVRSILVMRGIPIKTIITLPMQVIPLLLNRDSCWATENIALCLQNSSRRIFFFLNVAFLRACTPSPYGGVNKRPFKGNLPECSNCALNCIKVHVGSALCRHSFSCRLILSKPHILYQCNA